MRLWYGFTVVKLFLVKNSAGVKLGAEPTVVASSSSLHYCRVSTASHRSFCGDYCEGCFFGTIFEAIIVTVAGTNPTDPEIVPPSKLLLKLFLLVP